MSTVEHHIRLCSSQHYGRRVPPKAIGDLLSILPLLVQYAVRMQFEGRSTAKGRRHAWLDAASDIRFIDHYGEDETVVVLEAPRLGEAAPQVYEQPDFFVKLPDSNDTGLDLVADVVSDVARKNAESDCFDLRLLKMMTKLKKGFNGTFHQADLWGNRYKAETPARINPEIIQQAKVLMDNTPKPQRVRVSGKLDMIRASTLSFGLKLRDGQEARGVLQTGEANILQRYFQKDIVVLGQSVFRPSGRLLRIDAEEIQPAEDSDRFFSKMPSASRKNLDIRKVLHEQRHKKGLAAVMGKWPGEESDEEVEKALAEVS